MFVDGLVGNDVPNDGFDFKLDYFVETESIAELIEVIPPFFAEYFDGFSVNGYGKMVGKISGKFNDNSMPLITGELKVRHFNALYQDMKNVPITDGYGVLDIYLDLNQEDSTKISIKSLKFNTLKKCFQNIRD